MNVCLSHHLVEVGAHGFLVCDCVGCCKDWECSHIQAYKHLNGDINLKNELLLIRDAKRKGRPRKRVQPMHGFNSVRDEELAPAQEDYNNPNDLIATRIRRKLNDGRLYNGKVHFPRLKPSGLRQDEMQVWEVHYPHGQHGGEADSSDDDEVEIVELKQGRARYQAWLKDEERGGFKLYS